MRRLKRNIALWCAILVTTLATVQVTATPVGAPGGNFTLKSATGKNIRLSEHRGEVILLNFWASWCGPCRQEFPHLDALHRKYADLGFTVLGVNVEQDRAQADKVLRDIPVTFPILFDNTSVVSELYNVEAMPMTVLLDRSGVVRYVHHGYKPGYESLYEKQVRALVRE